MHYSMRLPTPIGPVGVPVGHGPCPYKVYSYSRPAYDRRA